MDSTPVAAVTGRSMACLVASALLMLACGNGIAPEPRAGPPDFDAASVQPSQPSGQRSERGTHDVTTIASAASRPPGTPGQPALAGRQPPSSVITSPTNASTGSTESTAGRHESGNPDSWFSDADAVDATSTLPGLIATVRGEFLEVWDRGEPTIVANAYLDEPSWSPDGTKLAYLDDRWRIVVNSYPDWGVESFTIGDRSIIDFRWSPTNDRLAVEVPAANCRLRWCRTQSDPGLWVIDIADGASRQVAVGARQPTWSPDGEHLAYLVGMDVHVTTASGDRSWLLHRFEGRGASTLEWGPAGWIAATVFDPTPTTSGQHHRLGFLPVREAEITSDDLVLLDHRFEATGNIAWDPTVTAIAVATGTGPLIARAMDGPLTPIGTNGVIDKVSWSPDGRWLAFDDGEVTVVAGTDRHEIFPLGQGKQPDWQP